MNMPTLFSTAGKDTELNISEELILSKLIHYQLKPQHVFHKLRVNSTELNKLEVQPSLTTLQAKLNAWQPCDGLSAFTQNMNQLAPIWLIAMQQGATLQEVMNLLRCFEIKSLMFSSTAKFHSFLLDILAETRLQQQDSILDYLLNYDADTQLPNANQILSNIEIACAITPFDHYVGIFSIQFQLSKNNSVLSISATAGLNKAIAEVLKANVLPDNLIHANGNLQFDILLPNLSGDIQLNLRAVKLHRAFEQMLNLENQTVLVTPYIGCAYALKPDTHSQDLLTNAKLALESALNTQQLFLMYSETLKKQLDEQNLLERQVLEAFSNDDLTLFFQPVVTLKDLKCVGAELLLRTTEQANIVIHAGLMVEIISKSGKEKLFTRWLINSACRFAAELQYKHQLTLYLTINLRAEDLYDFELPHMLSQATALWKINPGNLVLEVTEGGVLELNEATNSVINELAKNGFRLALDDFGTGFSSLSRLRNMPIDIIKIDQSFVRDIINSKEDYEIVKSIAALARSLGKDVIAEGVEDQKCMDLIQKMKINKCQGYFFAKPMPFDQFVQWAKQH